MKNHQFRQAFVPYLMPDATHGDYVAITKEVGGGPSCTRHLSDHSNSRCAGFPLPLLSGELPELAQRCLHFVDTHRAVQLTSHWKPLHLQEKKREFSH